MPNEPEEDFPEEIFPDRPIECGSCKKDIAVKYTEIVGQQITHTCMCSDCPVLERRLKGTPSKSIGKSLEERSGGLSCGNCGTTLESLRVGNPLGCAECYNVFADVIINELLTGDKVPQRIATTKKTTPLHLGRAPGEAHEINPSLRLLALNEALTETLKKEDYEQAALLRDQIKELTHKAEEEKGQENEKGK